MSKYIMRLDDACEKRNKDNWDHMEYLLDKYDIKPLVGVIPHCEDSMMDRYEWDYHFWDKIRSWKSKGWAIALHGYNHVYSTECGGINPVNKRSEFAGEPLEIQREKILRGISIMRNNGINPQIFFAPSHTFDKNTLLALKYESDIRIISDTIANKPYSKFGFIFVPQQSGKVKNLPFNTVTFCYHPNSMKTQDFEILESFLSKNKKSFISFPMETTKRRYSILDKFLNYLYMRQHR